MNKKYKNSPIVQSICEIRFSENEWKSSYIGTCYEKLKKNYNKEEEVNTILSGVGANQLGKVFNEITQIKETKFSHDEDKRSVTIGKNRLSVIKETPYTGWEDYSPLIIDAFEAYNLVSKQKKIERIGLRYINNIHIKDKVVVEKDYFSVYPEYTTLNKNCVAYDMRIIFDCGNNNFLNLIIIPIPSKEKEVTIFHLDFDYFTTKYEEKLNKKDIGLWLDKAHTVINEYFEKIITVKTRKLFK